MKLFGFDITRKKQPTVGYLGEFAKITICKGDVVVLIPARQLDMQQAISISTVWEQRFGADATLMLMDAGMKIGILAPERAAIVAQATRQDAQTAQAIDAFVQSVREA